MHHINGVACYRVGCYNSYAKEEAMDAISNMATTGIANMDASGSSANIKYEDIEITAGVTMKYAF